MRTQYVLRGVDHSDLIVGLTLVAVALSTIAAAKFSAGFENTQSWVVILAIVSGVVGFLFLFSAFKDRNEEDTTR